MRTGGRRPSTDLRSAILELMRAPDYRPLDKGEFARSLGDAGTNRVAVRNALKDLERAGEIARIRKNRYVLPAEADLVTGTIAIQPAGYGFLTNEKAGGADIFVAAENTWTAMNGDRVVARIVRDAEHSRGSRAEGRVIRILERANDKIVGTLQQTRNFFYVVPDDPRVIHNVYVTAKDGANRGDKVVARLIAWESRHINPEGEIIEVLGRAGAPGIDMLAIIRKHNLPTEFPPAVMTEAERTPERVGPEMLRGREDLRSRFIVTIDPDDARDFDDAIEVERLTNGGWRLGVHIADVAAYVKPGGALDKEALKRGNSVYLPDRVLPMLPERLSNGVCSLKPQVDRLTHSAFIEFDRSGRMRSYRFARTVIRSARRLTYREAYAILKTLPRDELGERLHGAWELAALLRRKRFQHGSLDLDFPEVKVRLDENGKPIALERIENDESHQLIEEFMLAANEAVALELKNRLTPTVYRIHENPDPDKLAEYRELALSYGHEVGDLTNRREVQRLLAAVRGKAEEQAVKIGLLKSLKRARYAPQPIGHYGLAKANYTHFTSPIRRYADLVVHRALSDPKLVNSTRIASIAEHISTTERTAADAEIEAVKLKKLEFFQQQLETRRPQIFRANVIDIRNYGLVVELPDALMTGLVHVSSLGDDFYTFNPARRQFVGRATRRKFSVGDHLKVFVARVDPAKQQVDFAISEEIGTAKAPRHKRR